MSKTLIPFDLERAIAGDKLITRDRREVEEFHYFKNAESSFPIVALLDGEIEHYTIKGRFYNDSDNECDLFMKEVLGEKKALPKILFERIEFLDMTLRTTMCLKVEGYNYIGDLVTNMELKKQSHELYLRQSDYFCLLGIPHFGKKSYKELLEKLKTIGYEKIIDYPDYISNK